MYIYFILLSELHKQFPRLTEMWNSTEKKRLESWWMEMWFAGGNTASTFFLSPPQARPQDAAAIETSLLTERGWLVLYQTRYFHTANSGAKGLCPPNTLIQSKRSQQLLACHIRYTVDIYDFQGMIPKDLVDSWPKVLHVYTRNTRIDCHEIYWTHSCYPEVEFYVTVYGLCSFSL